LILTVKKIICIVSVLTMLFVITAHADVRIPVLLYHHITDEFHEYGANVNISPEVFEAHLDALQRAGYKTISFDQYYSYALGTGILPYKPIIITFDDGYASNYIYAYPALRQRNMSATIFIVTSTVGVVEDIIPHFTWEEAAEMVESGLISIGSHSHTHPDLLTLSDAELHKELRLSRWLIEKNLGIRCTIFAYPFGMYNSRIFTAAAAAGYVLGIPALHIGKGLGGARGVKRRFEHKGMFNGADIVDDYAHHPTEIKANLEVARNWERRVICLFQPHNYSRTRRFLHEFAESFYDVDIVMLLPIYTSREQDHGDISSLHLLDELQKNKVCTLYADDFDDAVNQLSKILNIGDLLITMGAGDVYKVGERLLSTDLSTNAPFCVDKFSLFNT